MSSTLQFTTRAEFRSWLVENATSLDGFWLLFGKRGGPRTVKANEALEEALCFGWIDGLMKSLNETSYIKYFAARRPNSKWSDKNKALVAELEERGLMTELGRAAIEEAKKNGQWDTPKPSAVTDEHICAVAGVLEGIEPARTNFLTMYASVKKTYVRAYFDAKTDVGREKRLAWMIDRLNQNLKPM